MAESIKIPFVEAHGDPDVEKALAHFRRVQHTCREGTEWINDVIKSENCATLVIAGAALLRAAGQQDLEWLSRALVQKAIIYGSSSYANCARDCKRLRNKVDTLVAQQQASTRAYLDELTFHRSGLRKGDQDAEDHYYWDGVKALPEDLQDLVSDIICERIKRVSGQSASKTISDLQRVSTRERERAAKLQSVNEGLLQENETKTRIVAELEKRYQIQCGQMKALEKNEFENNVWRNRCLQAEEKVEEIQYQVQSMNKELDRLNILANGSEVLRLKEELTQTRESAASAHAAIRSERDEFESEIRKISKFCADLNKKLADDDVVPPVMEQELAQWRRLQHVGQCISTLLRRHRTRYKILEKERKPIVNVKEFNDLKSQLLDSERRRRCLEEEVHLLRESTTAMEARCKDYQGVISRLVSRFKVEDTPAYIELSQRCQTLEKDLADAKGKAGELQGEVERARNAEIELEAAKNSAEASQLHPAHVAAVRAELRHARLEWQATLNANSALRNELRTLQQALNENGPRNTSGTVQKVEYVLNSCARNVFNRLNEDALRRRELLGPKVVENCVKQDAQCAALGFDGLAQLLRVQTFMRRSSSEPGELPSSFEVRQMMTLNARSLKKIHQREELLLSPVPTKPNDAFDLLPEDWPTRPPSRPNSPPESEPASPYCGKMSSATFAQRHLGLRPQSAGPITVLYKSPKCGGQNTSGACRVPARVTMRPKSAAWKSAHPASPGGIHAPTEPCGSKPQVRRPLTRNSNSTGTGHE